MSNLQTPSIRNLKYLLALKQHLHFSNAAKACFISPSTLSEAIRNLEAGLNVKLVERDNHSGHIKQQPIFKDKLCLIRHKQWVVEEIGEGDLLLLEQGHCLRRHIVNQVKIRPSQIAQSSFSNLETLVAMIGRKIGVSFLPKMAIKSGILKTYPNLRIDKTQPHIAREIGLIYHQDSPWE